MLNLNFGKFVIWNFQAVWWRDLISKQFQTSVMCRSTPRLIRGTKYFILGAVPEKSHHTGGTRYFIFGAVPRMNLAWTGADNVVWNHFNINQTTSYSVACKHEPSGVYAGSPELVSSRPATYTGSLLVPRVIRGGGRCSYCADVFRRSQSLA